MYTLSNKYSPKEIILPPREAVDLTDQHATDDLLERHKPDVVLHCAGKVGGIAANKAAPGDFFYQNLMMGTNIIEAARKYGVKKTVVLAAGCGYPDVKAPFKESDFWNGLPDDNSIGYSMAKKMLIIQSWAYRRQYGMDSTVLLPANLYGPHDNFDLESSHVVPALIRKFVEAEQENKPTVEIWGTGRASREFLYVEDTAQAILDVAEKCKVSGPLNLGTGIETTILGLVGLIKELTGYQGKVIWDANRPDGQARRFYDMSEFKKHVGYIPSTPLKEGLEKTIKWYKKNQ